MLQTSIIYPFFDERISSPYVMAKNESMGIDLGLKQFYRREDSDPAIFSEVRTATSEMATNRIETTKGWKKPRQSSSKSKSDP